MANWYLKSGRIDNALLVERMREVMAERDLAVNQAAAVLSAESGFHAELIRARYRRLERGYQTGRYSDAFFYAELAMSQLKRMSGNDPNFRKELRRVAAFCRDEIKKAGQGGK